MGIDLGGNVIFMILMTFCLVLEVRLVVRRRYLMRSNLWYMTALVIFYIFSIPPIDNITSGTPGMIVSFITTACIGVQIYTMISKNPKQREIIYRFKDK